MTPILTHALRHNRSKCPAPRKFIIVNGIVPLLAMEGKSGCAEQLTPAATCVMWWTPGVMGALICLPLMATPLGFVA
jgi:hypothetical protein